jgi:UDP-N-acetylglucosamine 4,6-dehydratase
MIDWTNNTVLITGGTGSFGQAFVRKVLSGKHPKKLIIFSRDECKQYAMSQELSGQNECLRFFLGDVRDKERLYRAFQDVDVVVHAAALKQVPAAEYNPFEFVKTNVLGAANIVDAAIDRGVKKVITLSTDKAAGPINLYGATKLCSDKLFVTANAYAGERPTRFATVRYGNVIGSRGSIIPLLIDMRKTGVIKLTDKRMTRFWLTLEQGVDFVISSLAQMRGGEIFVPKIPSMKLVDLAEALAPDCQHEYIGIRPGEKLHETLVPRDESPWCLEFSDRYLIQPNQRWWDTSDLIEKGAVPVSDGFKYSSDCNSQWLTKAQLFALLDSSGKSLLHQPLASFST